MRGLPNDSIAQKGNISLWSSQTVSSGCCQCKQYPYLASFQVTWLTGENRNREKRACPCTEAVNVTKRPGDHPALPCSSSRVSWGPLSCSLASRWPAPSSAALQGWTQESSALWIPLPTSSRGMRTPVRLGVTVQFTLCGLCTKLQVSLGWLYLEFLKGNSQRGNTKGDKRPQCGGFFLPHPVSSRMRQRQPKRGASRAHIHKWR